MRDIIWSLRFSLKDLLAQKRIYLFLILNLFIGTFGFLVVQIFQNNLRDDLALRAQSMLGADFVISANRSFSDEDIKEFEKGITYDQKTKVIEFFGMLKNGMKSRLVTVRAFDDGYPFYGEIGSKESKINAESNKAWIDPELVQMLSINDQADLKLGNLNLAQTEIINKDSSRFFRGAGFAPVIYLSQKMFSLKDLITEGSTSRTFLLYQLTDPVKVQEQKNTFNQNIKDHSVRYETAQERAEGGNRTFKYFTDYLGLVAIVSISLCFLSGSYLMRWTFYRQRKNIGIYKSLGMSDNRIQWIYTAQVFVTSMASFLLSLLLFILLKPALNFYFQQQSLPFQLEMTPFSLYISLIIFVVAPLFMFMPINQAIAQLNPKDLFLDQVAQAQRSWALYGWHLVCLVGFWGLAFYQSSSYKVATLFTFAVLTIIILLKYFLALIFLGISKILKTTKLHWTLSYAIKSVINKKNTVDMVFMTFTISVLILTLLPHIKQSIINEIRPSQESALPRLFLFDVQSGQKDELEQMAKSQLEAKIDFNPLVRARILKLNNESYERVQLDNSLTTREQEEEVRFRNRGVNLTYQKELKPSESVVEGVWSTQKYTGEGIPEISLEERYAERVGAKLNDIMLFDVQGLEIQGKVTSIRSVRWTSFSPNFFILFQDGVLNEAPQNYLTAISTVKDYEQFQNQLMEKFPNISIIDVRQTVQDIMGFIDQMAVALQMMAVISIILGFFIFIVLVNTQVQERLSEFNLLKVMGANNKTIRRIIFIQFLFIVSLSLVTGLSLGLIVTRLLVSSVFSISTSFDVVSMSVVGAMLIPVVMVIVWRATSSLNRLSPMDLIRG